MSKTIEKTTVLSKLRDLIVDTIHKNLQGLSTEKKYGGLLFKDEDGEDHLCGIFLYKEHLSVEFRHGYLMPDPQKILQGKGKFRRHLKYQNEAEFDKKVFVRYLKEARKLVD